MNLTPATRALHNHYTNIPRKVQIVPDSLNATPAVGADIVDTAVEAGAFTTLAAALTAAGLVDASGNRVNVESTDVAASNGVIHVIDAVLLPAS